MDNSRTVKKYYELITIGFKAANLYSRMDTLYRKTVFTLPRELQREYEQIDEELYLLIADAELKYRKLYMGGIPLSSTYEKIIMTIFYWRMWMKHILNLYRNMRHLITLQKQLKYNMMANVVFPRYLRK